MGAGDGGLRVMGRHGPQVFDATAMPSFCAHATVGMGGSLVQTHNRGPAFPSREGGPSREQVTSEGAARWTAGPPRPGFQPQPV